MSDKKQAGRPRKNVDPNTKDINTVTNDIMEEIKPELSVENAFEPAIDESEFTGTFSEYNPLAENVVHREYATPPIAHNADEIAEPEFTPPSYEDIISQSSGYDGDGGSVEQEQSPFINPNPALNELDSQDQKVACEMLVDTILDGYEQLHEVGKYIARADEEALLEKQMQGKIHLEEQQIPISEDGTSMTLGEFVQTYNNQVGEALSYDKSFGEKVRPAMVRLFTKNGWGMTDGQYIGFMFGKDLVTKGVMMYSMKKAFNSTMTMLEKQYKMQKQASMSQNTRQVTDDDIPLYEGIDDLEEEIEIPITPVQPVEKPSRGRPSANKSNSGTKKLKIDFPKNPGDTTKNHPIEIQNELKKQNGNK